MSKDMTINEFPNFGESINILSKIVHMYHCSKYEAAAKKPRSGNLTFCDNYKKVSSYEN